MRQEDIVAQTVPAGRTSARTEAPVVLMAQAQGGFVAQPPAPPPPGPAPRIVRLPAGTALDNIEFRGDDIVLNQPAGEPVVIANGVKQPPTLFVGDFEIPAATIAAAFAQAGIVPGAGPAGAQPVGAGPGSSGGNFTVEPGDIGQAFNLTALLDPTALTFPTLEERELAPFADVDDEPPEALGSTAALVLDEAALPAGSQPGVTNAGATIAFEAGSTPITQFAFAADISGLRTNLNGVPGADIVWSRTSATEIIGQVNGVTAVTLTLSAPATIAGGSTGNATVTATLLGPLSGPAGGGPQPVDLGSVTVEATSATGVAQAVATLTVIDDVPAASNLLVGGAFLEGSAVQSLGPALAALGVAGGADGVGSISFAGGSLGGSVGIDPATGQLVYTPPPVLNHVNGAPRTETFSYTVVDGDGDPVTRTITVAVADTGVVQISATAVTSDEDDLAAGRRDSAPGDDAAVTTGSISYIIGPDGLGGVSLSAPSISFTKLDGTAIVAAWDPASRTLTGHAAGDPADIVFSLALGIPGAASTPYTFTLLQPVRHAGTSAGFEDNVTFSVDVTVTDGDGSVLTRASALQVSIDDDVPLAVPDDANGEAPPALQPTNYNLGFVLDFSTSVDNPNVALMVADVRDTIRSYFDNASGSVVVTLVAFGGSAVESGPFNTFAAVDAQLTAWETVRPVPNPTNYTRAIELFIGSYVPLPGFENQVYFVSDGRANTQTGPGDTPLLPATANSWNAFVAANGLDVTSVAVSGVTNLRKLQLIDVDGVGSPIRIEDLERLVETTVSSGGTAPITGNVLSNDLGGADGLAGVTAIGAGFANPAQAAGSAVAGAFGTLTIAADGAYSYLIDGSNAAVRTLAPGAVLADTFTYRVADNDGDGATTTLTIRFQGANGIPTAGGSIILNVSETALDTTLSGNDLAPASVTGTTPGSVLESDRAGAGGGDLRFIAPANEAFASVAFVNPVGSNAPVVSGLAAGYSMAWSINASGQLVGSLVGPGGTNLGPVVLIAMSAPVAGTLGEVVSPVLTATLVNALPHAPGIGDIQFGAILIEASDTNGDRARGVAAVTVADDAPLGFTPADIRLPNAGGTALTGDLDTAGSALAGVGADGPGTLAVSSFLSGNVRHTADGADSLLTFLGRPIFLYGFGTGALTGSTDANAADGLDPGQGVFRLTLDGASDSYRFDLLGMIDEGPARSLAGLSLLRSGQLTFNGFDVPGTTGDVLLSAFTVNAAGVFTAVGQVGGTSGQLGVNNASLDDGEVLGIDFVSSLSVTTPAANIYNYGAHLIVNGVGFTVAAGAGLAPAGSGELWVRAYDSSDDDPNPVNTDLHHRQLTPQRDVSSPVDPQDEVSVITLNGAALDLSSLASDGRGGFLVTGLSLGDRLVVGTNDGFKRLEIENPTGAAGSGLIGESVSVGDISYVVASPGRDFKVAAGVALRDADGDFTSGTIDIDFVRAARPNSIAGGPGDDVIYGGGGADTISGGTGADRFVMETSAPVAGITVADLILDYNQSEGDTIDLSAMLNALGANRPITAVDVDSVVNINGPNLQVDSNGLAAGGDMVTVATFAAGAVPSSVSVIFSETLPPAAVS